MRRIGCSVLILLNGSLTFSQVNPKVPSQMDFGGIHLKITEVAQMEIQKDVDALRASPKYFNIKVDRMNLYFPIIERIFKEERIPDEFKFLTIQESALISDAVSSANAVGFWQFKEAAGKEVGLRIDHNVDERLNIVAASRGAAKYLKRMNFYFNNWIYACLAYNTGPGGAKKHVDQAEFGVKRMTIDKNTFWYVKKFFAHYIAFRDEVGKPHSEGLSLIEYEDGANKSLKQIASKLKADEDLVFQYNKWLKHGDVPTEKVYTVIVPFKSKKGMVIASKKEEAPKEEPIVEIYSDIKPSDTQSSNILVKINNIKAIVAREDDNAESLAKNGGIEIRHLTRFNDLKDSDKIQSGGVYYLRSKKNKSRVYYHTVQAGETMWSISQKYGIKQKQLAKKNRMAAKDKPEPGRIMWLRKRRPGDRPVELDKKDVEIDEPIDTELVKPERKIEAVNPEPEKNFTIEQIPDEFTLNGSSDKTIPVTQTSNKDIVTNHLVLKSQTLYMISRMYGVTVGDIKKWNALTSNDLRPGQYLQLRNPNIVETINPSIREETTVLFHEVAEGETLYAIGRKYNVSVQELIEINLIAKTDSLAIGQKLQLERGDDPTFKERSPKEPSLHTVVAGDTMYNIGKRYNLTVRELMELNNKVDINLALGEKLKVSR
ncbi:MAG: LysM peptidoglycan-binding domain-containing protein [Bacteroidetes bacterium]|nr:LysM peptidoglycan-binding domain-containing protein [Bacteroidota bacterium]MDA1122320.1 LysM peptidoglycan-binding domain-containing protein [Bacteroidota bacterium]